MFKRIKFDSNDIKGAKRLWIRGWCWNAIAKHYQYSCCGSTIKRHVSIFLNKTDRDRHRLNHNLNCPKCNKEKLIIDSRQRKLI